MIINDLFTNKKPAVAEQSLNEFAPDAGGGDSGNYFQALASAWYNGTFDSGSLQKGIKSQEDVERLLRRGVIAPDGKTRKYNIDYNSNFEGVIIFSDDYWEYGDNDETIDSRTGQKWGPYDYMEFGDDDLDESAQWRDPRYKGQLYTQEKPDYNDTREYDRAMWNPKPKDYPGRKELPAGGEYSNNDPLTKGFGRSGIKNSILDRGKRKGLPSRDQITSLKGSIQDAHGRHTRANLPEGMEGQVVFSGTGDNGSTYEIIQSSPTDFMIHANGKHIDTYSNLQRAMSVLQNEVPGLQQGMAEGSEQQWRVTVGNKSGTLSHTKVFTGTKEQAIKQAVTRFPRNPVVHAVPAKQGMAEGTLDEAVGMMIKGAAISGDNDQDIADRIAAKTGGRVDSGSYGHHVLITYPTTQHRAMAAVKIRKMFPGIELYKSGGNRNAIDEQDMAEGLWDQHTSIPELEQAIKNLIMGYKGGVNLTDKGRAQLLLSINKGKRILAKKKQQQGVAEGMKAHELSQYCEELVAEKGWDAAFKHASMMANMGRDPAWNGVLKYLDAMKQDMAEGSELKQAKRKYNQAAKDANADQVGAGRKIDTMKNSLRQKDLNKQGMDEASLGDYRKKAAVSQAGAKIDRFFGRDDAAKVAAADQTITKREKGLARADARTRPYTPPTFDAEKQQRDLTTKYPNIDQLVADAERNRDPYYDRAEGEAYYRGREAEQLYQRLKQIQRVIQGLNESLNRSHLP